MTFRVEDSAMTATNKFGLKRYVPRKIAREIRRRSKFGCVICRCGLYQFEHIEPSFEDARTHDPTRICCLCGSCHERVTRGHLSKVAVKAAYHEIQKSKNSEVGPPYGPLDLHSGHAELLIGGLRYPQLPTTLVRYHGIDVMSVKPGSVHGPAEMNAIFTDDCGNEILRLEENTWIGSLSSWDIEIRGPSLTVRKPDSTVTLQAEIEAPGKLRILRMDMRIADCHILASDRTHVIGRYVSEDSVFWLHADLEMVGAAAFATVIEFASAVELKDRWLRQKLSGQFMAESREEIVFGNECGAMVIPAGIAIGTRSGAVTMRTQACGCRKLKETREVVFATPELVPQFIATGSRDPGISPVPVP